MPGPCIIAGLMAEGWVEPVARRYVAEEAVRRRSRSRDGRGGNPSGSEGLNSYVNSIIHAPDTAGTWIPDAEQTAQLSEEGSRRDD